MTLSPPPSVISKSLPFPSTSCRVLLSFPTRTNRQLIKRPLLQFLQLSKQTWCLLIELPPLLARISRRQAAARCGRVSCLSCTGSGLSFVKSQITRTSSCQHKSEGRSFNFSDPVCLKKMVMRAEQRL